MVKLNPKDYDYLWTDYDINFIFTSCYLFKEFKQADIVLIYDHLNKGLKFYLSKNYRRKLSNYGLIFYDKIFPAWKRKIIGNIKKGKELIEQTRKQKNVIRLMTNNEIKRNITQRVNLFQSLGGNYFYTEFFFLDRIEKLIDKETKKYENIIRNVKEVGKIKIEARKILNHFYNYRKIFKPYIQEIGRRSKRKDLPWLSYQEIIRVIQGEDIVVSDRETTSWLLTKKNNWKLIKGKQAVKMMKVFDNYFLKSNAKIIKGQIANPGRIEGTVKVIRTIFSDNIKEEIKKIKNGDILVAATTGPEIITACRKAGAIVTDEGGITSHAAIVSRELKKPCIIGTKIATKVLKDGDLVEVDADQGVVKILKK